MIWFLVAGAILLAASAVIHFAVLSYSEIRKAAISRAQGLTSAVILRKFKEGDEHKVEVGLLDEQENVVKKLVMVAKEDLGDYHVGQKIPLE